LLGVPKPREAVITFEKREIEMFKPDETISSIKTRSIGAIVAVLMMLAVSPAEAVPSMERQMGVECATCHTVFPELTPFGRQFKLRGFSMSAPKSDDAPILSKIPVSASLQLSRTATKNTSTQGATNDNFPRDRETFVQTAALYYGGKITDQSGALVQYNLYDGIERKSGMEMFDVRYANTAMLGKELVYGFTLNNSPTVSDIYNSTPSWSFPHTDSVTLMPAGSTLIDMNLASQVGGVGAYALWDDLVYAEFALYRTTNTGAFRFMGLNVPTENIIKGYAPYWRLALQREAGAHSVSVGTYGMVGKVYADRDDFSLGTDRFSDFAIDGQYQFIDGDHTVSTHATWIREKQEWNSSFAQGMASNPSTTLKTFRADLHYWYKRQWGGGLQYFHTRGDADDLRYNTGEAVMGSANGSPNSKGWATELNFLPLQNIKLALRYTNYLQFNGAGRDYDGMGRNAGDNNSIFLLGWFLF